MEKTATPQAKPKNKHFWNFQPASGDNPPELILYGDIASETWWGDEVTPRQFTEELDALGGEMAKAADECCIQYRLLNLRKGPAVWSLRAQADRRKYQERMKHTLECQEHLTVRQGEVVELRAEGGAVRQGRVCGDDYCNGGRQHRNSRKRRFHGA